MEPIRITDFLSPELDVYARLTERELTTYYEPHGGLFLAESDKVIERALEAGYEPVSVLVADPALARCREILERLGEIPCYLASEGVLSQLTGYVLTRGILCAMKRRKGWEAKDILAASHRVAILEEVMNPANVGAIFRSGAALGIDGILLTKGCSDPLYRRAIRVSMGNVFALPWAYIPGDWPCEGMALLKKEGYATVAMALEEDSLSLSDERLSGLSKMAIVLGTEGEGLKSRTLAECDYTVRIPMSRGVDSLNVAAASAVAFWELGAMRGERKEE